MKKLAFLILTIALVSCSKSPEQKIEEAKQLISNKNFSEAITLLTEIVEDSPESEQAPPALLQLAALYENKLDTTLKGNQSVEKTIQVLTTLTEKYPESEQAPKGLLQLASIYQNRADRRTTPMQSLEISSKLFKKVFEKYPESTEAPSALFMAGFIEANELRSYEDATKTLNLFLEKFPDHDLAESAKQELEFMGLTPEEILNRKVISKK